METKSEYPTPEQIKEMYEAWKSKEPGAIEEVLRKRHQERKEAKAEKAKDSPKIE